VTFFLWIQFLARAAAVAVTVLLFYVCFCFAFCCLAALSSGQTEFCIVMDALF